MLCDNCPPNIPRNTTGIISPGIMCAGDLRHIMMSRAAGDNGVQFAHEFVFHFRPPYFSRRE